MSIFKKIANRFKKNKLNEIERENAIAAFKKIKESAEWVDCKFLDGYYKQAEEIAAGFALTGQRVALAKAKYLMELVLKEKKLVELGYNRCVRRDAVNKFCDEHPSRVMMVCDISDYERAIPAEAQEAVVKTRDIFDQFIIVYTDHTRETQRKIEKVRDPILFGIFINDALPVEYSDDKEEATTVPVMSDRLYFLADWEDEHCDLTLARMISESKKMSTKVEEIKISDVASANARIGQISEP